MIYIPWIIFGLGSAFLIWWGFDAKRKEQGGKKRIPAQSTPLRPDDNQSTTEARFKGAEKGSAIAAQGR
ncbi:MAG TPA: hypothetical protein VFA90_12840 [Terriglobales bacterium]|nr:hypothetical protein [Terriglobales bacterium]